MIKIALKHWIYEACINVLFDKIFHNFNKPDVINLKVGDRFNRIVIYDQDDYTGFGIFEFMYNEYTNVEIKKVNKRTIYVSCDNQFGIDNILVDCTIDIKDIAELHR